LLELSDLQEEVDLFLWVLSCTVLLPQGICQLVEVVLGGIRQPIVEHSSVVFQVIGEHPQLGLHLFVFFHACHGILDLELNSLDEGVNTSVARTGEGFDTDRHPWTKDLDVNR